MPYLGVGLDDIGVRAALDIAPYDQVVQECLDPSSSTRSVGSELLVVWVRLEQLWRGQPAPLDREPQSYAAPLEEVAAAAIEGARALGAQLVFVLPATPAIRPLGIGDAANPQGVAATASAAREACRRVLASELDVLVVDAEDVIREVGTALAYDRRFEFAAQIPYTEDVFRLVARDVVRVFGLTRRPAPKVLVVDADGTLWAGEAADLASIELDGAAAAAGFEFQRLLADARRSGTLLALCSKNVEADVRAALDLPGMLLSWDDFSAHSVGWDSKVDGLRSIGAALNLGLSEFAFIDDSPAETLEVSLKLPQVRTVLLPRDPTAWPDSEDLKQVFDRLRPTADDMQRAERYAEERYRVEVQLTMTDSEYRERLAPEVRIFEPSDADIQRFAQLLERTNQFRLNSARYDQTELKRLAGQDNTILRLLEAWDSFGSYGIVGGAVVVYESAMARLLAFAVSCRALGRGIEEAFLERIAVEVQERWGSALTAEAVDTGRNEPAVRFFRAKGIAPGAPPSTLGDLIWPGYVRERR